MARVRRGLKWSTGGKDGEQETDHSAYFTRRLATFVYAERAGPPAARTR